jgi:hypothetical protein
MKFLFYYVFIYFCGEVYMCATGLRVYFSWAKSKENKVMAFGLLRKIYYLPC